VGDTTEVRPNDDSSWSTSSSDANAARITSPQGAGFPSEGQAAQGIASNIEINDIDA
jgi:hypothetical protein